jgi:hypothetical protein
MNSKQWLLIAGLFYGTVGCKCWGQRVLSYAAGVTIKGESENTWKEASLRTLKYYSDIVSEWLKEATVILFKLLWPVSSRDSNQISL